MKTSTKIKNNKFEVFIPKKISKSSHFKKACLVLERTKESTNHFFDVYTELGRGTTGAPSHSRQDLLRAMLVFTSSGLDIFLKQIIKDVLPVSISKNKESEKMFIQFIERRLKKQDSLDSTDINNFDFKLIAGAFGSDNPKDFFQIGYENDLIKSSLQSKDEIFRIAASFAITTEEILGNIPVNKISELFKVRNKIIHEMDIDFTKSGSNTTKRKQSDIFESCEILFTIMLNFLVELDKKLYAK